MAFTSQITANTNPTPIAGECFCINAITPASIKLNNSYYNVSVALKSTGETNTALEKFFVYSQTNASSPFVTNNPSPDILVYFNGTAVNPNQINYNLKSGDNLQANCLIPIAKYSPNTTMSITIYTEQAVYLTCFSINWIA